MKRYRWIIILISMIPLVLSAHEKDMIGGGHMMGSWNTTNLFWWIVIPISLMLAIFFIQALFKSGKKHSDASEILKIRYAKGEISKEDFEEMKKNLE